MDYQLLKVFVDDIMVRFRAHAALANAHHEPYTDAQVNALITIHAAIVSAHHTDHQVASAEDAEFKSVNIAADEAYKQNAVAILKTKATGNIFVGEGTGLYTTGPYNTFIGYNAGHLNTSGSYNTFIGPNAGRSNISGNYNTAIGYYAGYYMTNRHSNTYIGHQAGYYNTHGNYNTSIGKRAGFRSEGGHFNTYIGYQTAYNNIVGTRNTFIGGNAGYYETGSDLLYIANTNAVIPLIWGDFANDIVGIHMKPAVSKFGVADIPEYADNAAAVTAGLTVGEFYRTGDLLKIVH